MLRHSILPEVVGYKIARPAKTLITVSVEQIYTKFCYTISSRHIALFSTRTRLFFRGKLLEIEAGRLLIKTIVAISDYGACIATAKGNVCKQLISKYHITFISVVVTFGQIYSVWSDL